MRKGMVKIDTSSSIQILGFKSKSKALSVSYQHVGEPAVYRKIVIHPVLLPCPCCGGLPTVVPTSILGRVGVRVKCTACGLNVLGSSAPTVQEVENGIHYICFSHVVRETCQRWNKRPRKPRLLG